MSEEPSGRRVEVEEGDAAPTLREPDVEDAARATSDDADDGDDDRAADAAAAQEPSYRGPVDLDVTIGSPSERRFPAQFYDPLTNEIMQEPVVNPAGDSFDKTSVQELAATVSFYPNRALKNIIDRELELSAESFAGSLRRLDHTLRSGWGRLVEKSAFAEATEYRPLPDSFYCPITCDLITDPVVSKEGITYERDAIENWIRANGSSPFTRKPLTVNDLRSNNAVYELIQKEKGRNVDSVHPSIRRWRESGDVTSRREPMPTSVDESVSGPLQQQPPAPPAPTAAEISAALPPPAVPGVAARYPTTEAEIAALRRRRHARDSFACVVFVFTALVILLFFPFGFAVIAIAAISCCVFLGKVAD